MIKRNRKRTSSGITRINIWSSPRNVSTALMYSFAERPDTEVVDEPLYAHYLTNCDKSHPGRDEIIGQMENSGEKVVANMLSENWHTDVVFFKQMTHHLIQLDRSFLNKMENILLIRQPEEIIFSYSKVIPKVQMEDIGIKMQYDLYNELIAQNKVCAVLDAKNLLTDPEQCLKQLCDQLGIPFFEQMLTWKPGPRPEDGVWAKYWYANVHKSTGFMPYSKKEINLDGDLLLLAENCKPFYNFLYERSIKI